MSDPLRGFDLSRAPENLAPKLTLAIGAGLLALFLSLLLLNLPILAVIAIFVGAVFAAISLVNPYAGLLLYLMWEFVRPAEIFPILAPLHLQRGIAVVVLSAWLLSRMKKGAEPLVSATQNRAMMAFLGVMILSIPTAYLRSQALDYTIDFGKAFLMYLLVTNLLSDQRRLNIFLWLFIALIGWIAAGAIHTYFTGGVVLSEGVQRAVGKTSLLSDPNDLATTFAAGIPFTILLFPAVRSRFSKAILVALSGTLLLGLALTGSRGGSIALAVVFLMLWVRSRKRLAVGVALVGLVALMWIGAPGGFRQRVLSIGNYSVDATAMARREAWKAGTYLFLHNPLVGVGAGNFGAARAGWYGVTRSFVDWQTAHSIFFQLLAELGIGGITAFGWIMLSIFRDTKAVRRKKDQPDEYPARITHAIDVSLVGMLAGGAFLSSAYHPILYLLAAMAVAQRRIAEKELEEESSAEDPVPEPLALGARG